MGEFIERQRPIIERSGMGLLPGLLLALLICLGFLAAVVTGHMWVLLGVVAGIVVVTGVVMAIISGLIGKEDEIYSHDD
jgi:hypothetical protein